LSSRGSRQIATTSAFAKARQPTEGQVDALGLVGQLLDRISAERKPKPPEMLLSARLRTRSPPRAAQRGPNGVGKSTLARNIAHQALIHGHDVRSSAPAMRAPSKLPEIELP
jgi:ATPase subunit of ABC transporter with duplicated ATPase domains